MHVEFIDKLTTRLSLLHRQSNYAERLDGRFQSKSNDAASIRRIAEAALKDQNRSGYTVAKALDYYVQSTSRLQGYDAPATAKLANRTVEKVYVDAWTEFYQTGSKTYADRAKYVSTLAGIDHYCQEQNVEISSDVTRRYPAEMSETVALGDQQEVNGKAQHPAVQYVDAIEEYDYYVSGRHETDLLIQGEAANRAEIDEYERVLKKTAGSFLRSTVAAVTARPAKRLLVKALNSPAATPESVSVAIKNYVDVRTWQSDLRASLCSPTYALFSPYAESMTARDRRRAVRQAVNALVPYADCDAPKQHMIYQALRSVPGTADMTDRFKRLPRTVPPNMADPRVEFSHMAARDLFAKLHRVRHDVDQLRPVAQRISAETVQIRPDCDPANDVPPRPLTSQTSSSDGTSFETEKDFEKPVWSTPDIDSDISAAWAKLNKPLPPLPKRAYAGLLSGKLRRLSRRTVNELVNAKAVIQEDLRRMERSRRLGSR